MTDIKANLSGAGADPGVPHLDEVSRQRVRDALALCFGDSAWDQQQWRIVVQAFDDAWPDTAVVRTVGPARLFMDMARASVLVDEADDATGYQVRLVAPGMIARQYIRESAAAARLAGSPEKICTFCDLQPLDSESKAEVAPGDGRIADAVLRIRKWLVQSGRYTASTIELDRVLHREIQAALSEGDGRAARLQPLVEQFRDALIEAQSDIHTRHCALFVVPIEQCAGVNCRRAVELCQELARTLGGQPEGQ